MRKTFQSDLFAAICLKPTLKFTPLDIRDDEGYKTFFIPFSDSTLPVDFIFCIINSRNERPFEWPFPLSTINGILRFVMGPAIEEFQSIVIKVYCVTKIPWEYIRIN
jgi:hypothetical protein